MKTSQVKEFIVSIKDDRCKGCAICVEICPKNVLAMSKEPMASGYLLAQVIARKPAEGGSARHGESPVETSGGKCIGCMECELHCPDLAVEVKPAPSKAGK